MSGTFRANVMPAIQAMTGYYGALPWDEAPYRRVVHTVQIDDSSIEPNVPGRP